MAGFDEPFDAWLSARLGALDLDADVYAEYVSGILADEDMPLDERAEQASQLVAAALDEEYAAAAAGLETELQERWLAKGALFGKALLLYLRHATNGPRQTPLVAQRILRRRRMSQVSSC